VPDYGFCTPKWGAHNSTTHTVQHCPQSGKYKHFSIQFSLISERTVFFKVPRLRQFVVLVRLMCRWRWERGVGGMIVTGGNQSSRSYTCLSGALSTKSHASISMRSNLGLCGDRPTIGRLSHDITNNHTCDGWSVSLSWHARDRKMCLHGNQRRTEQCTSSGSYYCYTFNMLKNMK
jgi:hypothetical protein